MNQLEHLAAEIIKAWHASTAAKSIADLPEDHIQILANIAAKQAIQCNAHQQMPMVVDGKIIDKASGLVLPPEPGRPYRERGHHPDGSRLTLFDHLRNEYGPYLDAHLLFSGHLQDIDRPAYEALLYLARKDAREKRLDNDVSNTAAFFLEHGILAGEHLEFPPAHLTRQVDIINKSRALTIIPKIRGRRPSKGTEPDLDR